MQFFLHVRAEKRRIFFTFFFRTLNQHIKSAGSNKNKLLTTAIKKFLM